MQMTPLFEDNNNNTSITNTSETRSGFGSGLLGDDVGDDDGPSTWVAVGMTVDVEERGEHVYIRQ